MLHQRKHMNWIVILLLLIVYLFRVSSLKSLMSSFTSSASASSNNILVTGGAGYIGSHTVVCLLNAGYDITIVDNLVNANSESINRVKEITGCDDSRIRFFNVDLCDEEALEKVFQNSPVFKTCVHFAALKAVGESVQLPLLYYKNNLGGTFNLISLMDKYGCRSIVFSSSATVYGSVEVMPITEDTQAGVGITNAYGRTKHMIENILQDFHRSKQLTSNPADRWSVALLRYFNPVGAHPSGRIGEDPNGVPNNLMPYVAQVVVGRRPHLTVFGNDYNTKDGTGVRDYIHVMDVAEGHLAALKFMEPNAAGHGDCSIFNLGTGIGVSVLEMIEAMKEASGRPLPYVVGARREGDIAVCYADVEKAKRLLGWSATRTLFDMCKDLWNWQSNNPNGFAK